MAGVREKSLLGVGSKNIKWSAVSLPGLIGLVSSFLKEEEAADRGPSSAEWKEID